MAELVKEILVSYEIVTLLAALTKPAGTKSKDKTRMYFKFFIMVP